MSAPADLAALLARAADTLDRIVNRVDRREQKGIRALVTEARAALDAARRAPLAGLIRATEAEGGYPEFDPAPRTPPAAPECSPGCAFGRVVSSEFGTDWVEDQHVKGCPARPDAAPRFKVQWENAEGTIITSPGEFDQDAANTHASAMGGWVVPARPDAAPPRCTCIYLADWLSYQDHRPDCPARGSSKP